MNRNCKGAQLIEDLQIEAMTGILRTGKDEDKLKYLRGLALLLDAELAQPSLIRGLLLDDHAIHRKYGVVLAKKACSKFPELIRIALDSKDLDIRTFAKEAVEENNLY